MQYKPVFILGSFAHPHNHTHHTSAAEQLAALFQKNKVPVITATTQYKKVPKFIATVFAILSAGSKFRVAIIPLYGTPMSFIWQEVSAVLLKLLRKKIILVVHGGSIPEQMQQGDKKFHTALRRADVIVCPSPYMQQFLQQFGYKSLVIENVLDIASYPFQHKKQFRPRILWMRSFSDIYHPFMAVEVAALLAKKYPGFYMAMAGGDLGLLQQTKGLVASNGLEDKVRFPGYLSHQDKIHYAADYDIYICTNRIDNAPVTVTEYMALGLAVVSVDTGGIPFMISNGYNGLLVPFGDAAAMAAAIETILHNPAMGQQLCSHAKTYAEQYAEKPVFDKWVQVLEQLN